MAARVGRNGSDPEGQHAEVLAQGVDGPVHAAASPVGVPLRRDDAAGNDLLARVFGEYLERLLHVDGREHVGGAEGRQGQHAVVDGPQRDFARGAAPLAIRHVERHRRGVGGPVLFLVGCHRDGQALARVLHPELQITQPERGLARVARIVLYSFARWGPFDVPRLAARRRRPFTAVPSGAGLPCGISKGFCASLHKEDRHIDIRNRIVGDRHVDRLLRGRQRELPIGADAFAFRRDERRRLLPWRLDHDPRGVSGFVGAALGDEIDAVVIVALPGGVAAAERVERLAGDGKASLTRICPRLENEVAAGRQVDDERHRCGRARQVPLSGGHIAALRFPAVESVPLGAAHTRPLDLRQLHVDRDTGDRRAVKADGDEFGLESSCLLAEPRHLPDADVPRRGVHEQARAIRDVLPRDVLDVSLQRVRIGHASLGIRVERERQLARRRQRRIIRPHLESRFRTLGVGPSHELPSLGRELVGNRRGRGVDGRPREGPMRRTLSHRRAEQVARRHHPVQRIPRQA